MKPLDLKTIDINGLHLIEASAGTGKTWTIAALYILILLEKQLSPDQILVVTYTKAATAELKERIRQRIVTTLEMYAGDRPPADDLLEQILTTSRQQEPELARRLLTRALYAFDDAAIFTIHGFCQRALTENCFESGSLFDSEMISDQELLLRQVQDDFWRSRILTGSTEFIRMLMAEGLTPEKLAAPFRGHFQTAGLRITPVGSATDFDLAVAPVTHLLRRMSKLWQAGRDLIPGLIEQARLNQRSYSPTQIATAARTMENWLNQGNGALPCPKLEFFTKTNFTKAFTKNSTGAPEHLFFTICQEFLAAQTDLRQAYKDRIIAYRHELKQWFEAELLIRKQSQNQRCFDDLLLDLNLALEGVNGDILADRLRDRFRTTLIDEFQDTDPLQWQIFSRIAGTGQSDYPLFLIGDPKQAIYSFRGADIFAYLQAGKAVGAAQQHTLTDNFRSVPRLVAGINTLFAASDNPFIYHDIEFTSVMARRNSDDALLLDGAPLAKPLQFLVHRRNEAEKVENKSEAASAIVTAVAAEIAGLLEPGRCRIRKNDVEEALRPGDMAVLVRSHRQADQVQQALSALHIPSVQHGSSTIYRSDEAMDLLRILRAALEPFRESLLREALLTRTLGQTANAVASCLDSGGEDREWELWLGRFRALNTALRTGGVIAFMAALLDQSGVRQQLLLGVGGERALTNLLHCCELLHRDEVTHGINPRQTVTGLERHITGQERDDACLLRLESDANAVIISTIHTSKGLQYPLVFVPFAWDTPGGKADQILFHDADGTTTIDLSGNDKSRDLARKERDAELARLLYVALTRGELFCQVAWGCINGAQESPLFRLLSPDKPMDKKQFGAMTDQQLVEDIRALSCKGEDAIEATLIAQETVPRIFHNSAESANQLIARQLNRSIADDWRVASFSGMTAGSERSFQPRDHDASVPAGSEPSTPQPETAIVDKGDIFHFPKGAEAGSCLHEIFEQLDFAASAPDQINRLCRKALADYGFDQSWQRAVVNMVTNVCNTPLLPDAPDFLLSRLRPASWQCEMEFYLPLRLTTPETMVTLFDGMIDRSRHGDFTETLRELAFRPVRGMLQGFIDMIFEHQGRYYIIDWKSNHLGNRPADYGTDPLIAAMNSHAYILQYHLYAIALDSLLRVRLPNYDYQAHFGGAIYIFLRGVTPQEPGFGIFHDCPNETFIRRARHLLIETGSQVANTHV